MTPADWRALIEAYLDGRLSAEAFMRRFIEGWQAGAPLPRAIADLQVAVEAFEAQVNETREEGAVSDDELRQAAQRALANLGEEGPGFAPQPHTFDRTRAREEMRRFRVQMTGCASIGCALAAIWIGLSLLQVYFVIEWVHASLDWPALFATVAGFVLAFVPVIGNVLAFLGATAEGWPSWLAAIVFFAAPAATVLSGWSRWRSGPRG
ncbi:MAG: hypothetical protein R3C25_13075 [Hyphomonadaceae bacterium]